MGSIRHHHLTDTTLQQYAAGALSPAMETLVACHLSTCARCRAELGVHEAMGGAVLGAGEAVAPRASAAEALARARALRDPRDVAGGAGDARGARGVRLEVPDTGVPRPLGRLLPGPLDALEWHITAPGLHQINLSSRPRTEGAFKLLHCAPGLSFSAHTHRERELTVVLRGAYTDEIGRFGPGDVSDLDETVVHRPVVVEGEPCVMLIATDSPVRYTELLGTLMQPFVGI